jgi:hypothetical protein
MADDTFTSLSSITRLALGELVWELVALVLMLVDPTRFLRELRGTLRRVRSGLALDERGLLVCLARTL